MKIIRKNNRKIISILTLASVLFLSLLLTSCEGDADSFVLNEDVISDLENGILNGQLSENYTLDSNITYQLTSSFVVSTGAELTIPEGTNIIAKKGGSNIFIAVLQGGKIFVNGTAEKPVTISTEDGEPGGWSGITIFGGAPSLGIQSASDVFYGGDREDDNSGSINYLKITGAGNFLSSNQKTNGLALYGVGSGTEINNVALINSAEDAIDIYGGTVSINNLFIENSGGHSINWNEGWNGTITNTYILDKGTITSVLGANFNQEDKENPVDFDFPTFNNLTVAVSEDFKANLSGDNTLFKLHTETGVFVTRLNVTENIYDVDVNMLDGGDVTNLSINGSAPDVTLLNIIDGGPITYLLNSGKDSNAVDLSIFDWRN